MTAVELLPVHHFVDESFLADRGLHELLGLRVDRVPRAARPVQPPPAARGEQVAEFKDMVKTLHAAGIEVILDVVFNHTAEGNHLGPTPVVQGRRLARVLPAAPRTRASSTTTRAPATA